MTNYLHFIMLNY